MSGHEHDWTNGPVLRRSRVGRSPYSTLDDHLWDDVIQVQTCGCGATRRLVLGFENRRRRGDDYRRANGLPPLGRPLGRKSGTYPKPIIVEDHTATTGEERT